MKKINIIIGSLCLLLSSLSAFAGKDPAQAMSSYSSDVESHLIGIWQNQDDSRYYYEFTSSGEFIRYKVDEERSKKSFGKYKIIDSQTIVITFNGIPSEDEIHFDNNYNTLIWQLYNGDEYRRTICKRINPTQFKKIIQSINWRY